jgi:hypothetical protein
VDGSVAVVGEVTAQVWTTDQVAEHCGIAPQSVSNKMARLGVPVHDREPGRGGRNRYLARLVRAKVAAAPGKGNRTPRKTATPPGGTP